MKAIYKRELRSYFTSMIGYIFIAAIVVFVGLYFMRVNLIGGDPSFVYALASSLSILIIALPILTMKCFSEERKNKTDQLLLTAPVKVISIVLGKYLSMLTVFAIPLLIFCFCPLIIASFGTSYILGDYMGILAMLLMGAMLISIGMFISSMTENQLVSAIISLAAMLLLFFWDSLVNFIPTTALASFIGILIILALLLVIIYLLTKNKLAVIIVGAAGLVISGGLYLLIPRIYEGLMSKVLGAFSLTKPFYNFALYYLFDVSGVIMYITVSALFVFLTVQTIQKRRWS